MTTEQIVQRELDRWQWMCKKNEKFTNIIDRVNNHRDLSEEDWDLLRVEFGVYEDGAFPLYQSVLDLKRQNVTEVGLFASDKSGSEISENTDRSSENNLGIEIAIPDTETKTEEENE